MKYLIIAIVLLSPVLLISQTQNTFKEKVMAIAKDLHLTNGNFIHKEDPPESIIEKEGGDIAFYQPYAITIDSILCELFQNFGEHSSDALAYVIGHELTHCYMEDSTFLFIDYVHGDTSQVAQEKAADIYGLFNAYLAGYKSLKLVPEIIDTIYSFYDLPDHIPGNLSREERKKIAIETQKQVEQLINIYETANYLSAIGKYNLAGLSYQYILKFYQGREIYNNIGVNQALHAMNEATKSHYDLYLYPIELDSNIRLKKPKAARGGEEENIERAKWLNNALRNFLVVTRMDPSYYTADINIMCIYILQEKYEEAIVYYNQHFRESRTKQYPIQAIQKESADLALAIAKAHLAPYKKEAKKLFKNLKNSRNTQIATKAAYNLEISEEGRCGIPEEKECADLQEAIDLIVDGVVLHRTFLATSEPIILSNNITLTIDQKKASIIYQFYENESPILLFQQILSKKIPVQDIVTNISSSRSINTSNGYFLSCATSSCVYWLSSTDQLKGWGKYYAE